MLEILKTGSSPQVVWDALEILARFFYNCVVLGQLISLGLSFPP